MYEISFCTHLNIVNILPICHAKKKTGSLFYHSPRSRAQWAQVRQTFHNCVACAEFVCSHPKQWQSDWWNWKFTPLDWKLRLLRMHWSFKIEWNDWNKKCRKKTQGRMCVHGIEFLGGGVSYLKNSSMRRWAHQHMHSIRQSHMDILRICFLPL